MKLTVKRPKITFEKKWPDIVAGALHAMVFVLGGMLLARWIWLLFAPTVPLLPVKIESAANSQSATILAAHWFGVTTGSVAMPVANINFKLMGVYAPTASKHGFAIFKMADGKQKSVLLHQEIAPGLRLQSIQQEAVQVGPEGNTQTLALENRQSKTSVQSATGLKF